MSSDTYSQARAALRRPDFFETVKWKDQQIRSNRDGAHPAILHFEKRFVAKMKSVGIPMFAHCVIRTNHEQDRLYQLGRSKARAGQSPHQKGRAVDLIHSTMGWELPADNAWKIIGALGKEVAHAAQIPIEWGGDWSFYDPAHWQLKYWPDDQYMNQLALKFS